MPHHTTSYNSLRADTHSYTDFLNKIIQKTTHGFGMHTSDLKIITSINSIVATQNNLCL